MDETVTLRASRWQFLGLTGVYCLLVATTFVVVTSFPFLLLTLVVLMLFWLHDYERHSNDDMQLRIGANGKITLSQLNRETCYPECRMYYNRWCMVLKLKNNEHNRSIILTADRFEDVTAYAAVRYHLCRLEDANHAA